MMTKIRSVLLIDDDEATNFINSILFEEAACSDSLKVTSSATEALDYLRNAISNDGSSSVPHIPELIFLDINMPVMNGWEFLEEYRQLPSPALEKTVVIMLTTSLYPNDIKKAGEMPEIAGFENKPLSVDTIRRLIQSHFEFHMNKSQDPLA